MNKLYLSFCVLCAIVLPGLGLEARASVLPPMETVRAISVEGDVTCSAVVVAPNVAITARHCLSRGLEVDSIAVAYITAAAPENEDIAMLYAPGLLCPCAVLGERPAVGSPVLAIGFPQGGARRITAVALVRLIGKPVDIAPFEQHPIATGDFIITDAPILDYGDSGGGLFTIQDGEWVVVGVNSIGIPAAPYSQEEQGSGFVPVDMAVRFLPKS